MEKAGPGRPKAKAGEVRKPMIIRPLADMDAFIRTEAQRNGSSCAAEIYRSIRERMDRQAAQRAS